MHPSVSYLNMSALFECLSVPNVVEVFGRLLCAQSVLLSSSSLCRCVEISQLLLQLLAPFTFSCTYIPLLTYTTLDAVQCPFPFLMATHVSLYKVGALLLSHPAPELCLQNLEARGLSASVDSVVNIDLDEGVIRSRLSSPPIPATAARHLRSRLNAAWKREIAAHDEADADPQTFTDNVQKAVLLFYTEILQGHSRSVFTYSV